MQVGGEVCKFVTHTVPQTRLTCRLPVVRARLDPSLFILDAVPERVPCAQNVGFNRRVVVTQGKTFSHGEPLVDYLPPKLISVTGCPIAKGDPSFSQFFFVAELYLHCRIG